MEGEVRKARKIGLDHIWGTDIRCNKLSVKGPPGAILRVERSRIPDLWILVSSDRSYGLDRLSTTIVGLQSGVSSICFFSKSILEDLEGNMDIPGCSPCQGVSTIAYSLRNPNTAIDRLLCSFRLMDGWLLTVRLRALWQVPGRNSAVDLPAPTIAGLGVWSFFF